MKRNLFENLNEKRRLLKLISAAFVSAAVMYSAHMCISSAMRRADILSDSRERIGLEHRRQNRVSDVSANETEETKSKAKAFAMHASSDAEFSDSEMESTVDRKVLGEGSEISDAEDSAENVRDNEHFHNQVEVKPGHREEKVEIVSPEFLKQAVVLENAKKILQIFDCRTEGISVCIDDITSEQMKALIFLLRLGVISSLKLNRCAISEDEFRYMMNELKCNTTLIEFDLSGKLPVKERIILTSDFNIMLKELGLHCGVNDSELDLVMPSLHMNSVLQRLDLSYNQISNWGAHLIASELKSNTVLTSLILSHNRIGDRGVQYIAAELKYNSTLHQLCLSGNYIGDTGADAIVDILKFNTALKQLDIGYSKIKTWGIRKISGALEYNTTLEQISLCGVPLTDVGLDAIACMLINNIALIRIDLSGDEISSYGADKISKALIVNKTLLHLNLSNNKLGAIGAYQISDMLRRNSVLTECNLSSNDIGDVGLSHISRALWENKTLKWLDLRFNGIRDYYPMSAALSRNTSLTTLYLHDSDRQ